MQISDEITVTKGPSLYPTGQNLSVCLSRLLAFDTRILAMPLTDHYRLGIFNRGFSQTHTLLGPTETKQPEQ